MMSHQVDRNRRTEGPCRERIHSRPRPYITAKSRNDSSCFGLRYQSPRLQEG